MQQPQTFTAFIGSRHLATGARLTVALAVKAALQADDTQTILIFDDATGSQIDFDLRGTDQEIAARLGAPEPEPNEPKRQGRPKLGVVAREVTLLPRHWDWLAAQPGGASVTLRKLVDAARQSGVDRAAIRQAQQAADRFMMAMLGNQQGYEDAARALYAGDWQQFATMSESWPKDLRDHARRLAEPAFTTSNEPAQ
ncbi:DUF2239 family protein [Microvirga puerhi]|uniref:DUF2239 family protein n=1 Tax=Microvirga puerhi TaxID=2876078 RepID=A0ABS7VNI0_9HYPH|nr:DUF2239 family protein [Microvirga puerhi]MBZ6077054.1 DUF2239 family protein [Microvirga puerhi]